MIGLYSELETEPLRIERAIVQPRMPSLSEPFLRAVNSLAVKRALDIVGAAVGLLLLAPLFLIVALAIKATDGGSVFVVQWRVGLGGLRFRFFKFRSMVPNAEELRHSLDRENVHTSGRGITFKIKNDPRVTWIGRIIRKLSIDELPQLWNVLKGDMSLVGPRPPLPREVELYSPYDMGRLSALPGITCLWQILGRANLPFEDQVDLDLQYIESRTLWLDLWILAKTIPAVLSCHGAY